MKTAAFQDLGMQSSTILTWLKAGETIVLLKDGERLGRIVPEQSGPTQPLEDRQKLFARRFSPLAETPNRDLSGIMNENRGEE